MYVMKWSTLSWTLWSSSLSLWSWSWPSPGGSWVAVWSIHPGWEHGRPHCPAGRFANRIWGNIALAWQDLDITSKVEANGWRKVNIIIIIIVIVIIATNIVVITMMQVNSLAHYGVKEKALVSLVPKQIDSPSHHIYQVSQMWQRTVWKMMPVRNIVSTASTWFNTEN